MLLMPNSDHTIQESKDLSDQATYFQSSIATLCKL